MILEIRNAPIGPEYERQRELEIKKIITELELGYEAVVKIECKIGAYRTSFEYFKNQYNIEMNETRRFSFLKTTKFQEWIIKRTK